jgi:nitroreductase
MVNDHVRLLRELRSVRRFTSDPVPQHLLDDLLEVARWTGSRGNRQPWEVILVRARKTLETLGAVAGAKGLRHLAGAAVAFVLVPSGPLAEFDAGRWAERVMLAAAAHSLGSSVAWFPEHQAPAAMAVLGVPPDRPIRTAISVGYPADDSAHLVSVERDVDHRLPLAAMEVGRKPLAEMLHVERYGQRMAEHPTEGNPAHHG